MVRPLESPPVLEAARRAFQSGIRACDSCLGRVFARIETGLSNAMRASILRNAAPLSGSVKVEECEVCLGAFDRLPLYVEAARRALERIEFETLLVGTRVDPHSERKEAELVRAAGEGASPEPLHTELNREIGKALLPLFPHARFDPRRPDVTVLVDVRFGSAEAIVSPLFIYGRYRKLVRGLPQTVWPCRRCRGRGCRRCEGRGKMYETSVQEIIQSPFLAASGAKGAEFHGAGREDVDARCLGTGRPFVLELKSPQRRRLDLEALALEVNATGAGRVEIEGIRWARREDVVRIKEFRGEKTYRARIAFLSPVDRDNLFKAALELRGKTVAQRTPERVHHRRADKVRERRVLDFVVERFEGTEAVVLLRGDAGLYVKELVSGDGGRTRPSLSELVGAPCEVRELDVLSVEESPPVGPLEP